jgi:RecB family exonuclease
MKIVDTNKDLMSISRFLTYMRCPALFKAIYVDKSIPRTFNIHAHVGSTVHAAHEFMCAQVIKSEGIPSLKDVQAYAKDYWDSKADEVPDLLEEILAQEQLSVRLIETYFKFFEKADIKPKFTEERVFWYPEGYNFGLQGIIDRIDMDGHVCDLKTSGKTPPKSRATGKYYVPRNTGYDLQMDTYFMLAREGLNIDVPGGSFEYIVKTKTPKVVKVNYDISELHMNSTLDLMANLHDAIQKGNFPPNRLGPFCSPTSCANWHPCTGL